MIKGLTVRNGQGVYRMDRWRGGGMVVLQIKIRAAIRWVSATK